MWLKYISYKNNIYIRHAKNGYEHKIGQYKLDGYYKVNDQEIGYEFHGCLYHGCLKCYSPKTYNPIKQESMEDTFSKHCTRIRYLKERISTLIEIWECEWDQLVKNDSKIQ